MAVAIDEATLTTVLGLVSLTASALFFILSAFARHIPGVRLWAMGCLAIGFAMVIDGPRLIADWRVASVVFNIPFSIGHAFILAGTMQFCGRRGARQALWSLAIVSVLLTLVFTFIDPDARWRIFLLSALQAAINLWTALILWRFADKFSYRVFLIAGAAELVQACAALTQALLVASSPVDPTYGSPELPLANLIIWGGALMNTLAGNAMLLLLVMARLVVELRTAAERDVLTGLLNRRGMRLHFDGLLARTVDLPATLGILILDIDHFKAVNDSHGHDAGDQVLKLMGEILLALDAPLAMAARWGGEEFCVVLEGASRDTLLRLAEDIRARFAAATARLPALAAGKTVSVGIALTRPGPAFEVSQLISMADAQLYKAKLAGRDRIAIAD